jgi:hypothetical protein
MNGLDRLSMRDAEDVDATAVVSSVGSINSHSRFLRNSSVTVDSGEKPRALTPPSVEENQ